MDRKFIEESLIKIGIPTKLDGFNYIVEAELLLCKEEWQTPKWTALYSKVGTICKCTPSSVERGIRHSLEKVKSKQPNSQCVQYYLGGSHATNSESLATLHIRLKNEEENNCNDIDENTDKLETLTNKQNDDTNKNEGECSNSNLNISEERIRQIIKEELEYIVSKYGLNKNIEQQ